MEDCIWEAYTIVNQWGCGGDFLIPYLDYQYQSQSLEVPPPHLSKKIGGGMGIETLMNRFNRLPFFHS